MKKVLGTTTSIRGNYCFMILIVSMFIFLSGIFFHAGIVCADDATAIESATFTSSTLILDIPELAVEGADLLYNVQLQLKQEGDNIFLELIELCPSQNREPSIAAATLSIDGVIHIPLLLLEDGSIWVIDLNLMNTVSLLPIRFTLNTFEQMQVQSSPPEDDLLGARWRCVVACLGKQLDSCVQMCCHIDGTHCQFDYLGRYLY